MSTQLQTQSKAGSKLSDALTANNAVKRHFSSQRGFSVEAQRFPIQAKLKISQPGDKYEQEADRVADQVMRMPEPAGNISTGFTTPIQPPIIQRMCPECEDELRMQTCEECEEEIQLQPLEEEEELIQAKKAGDVTPEVTPAISADIQSLQGGGRPLSGLERGFFEPRFGADFSNVRVHNDTQAAGVARSVNARAFTFGGDVVFGAGQYAPECTGGRSLLAHELTHVVQQGEGKRQRIQRHVLENDPSTAPGMTCDVATSSPSGVSLDVTFNISSSILSTADKAAVSNFVRNWHLAAVAEPVRIDGYASIDGSPSTNWPLSCRRAETLANELMTPSDGSPGIPASSITLFAQGETDQFSSAALEPNRRAQAHIPSTPTQPSPCPAGVKTIAVDFVRLHGSTRSPTTDLAVANTAFNGCCVRFQAGATPPRESQVTTESWLGGDTELTWHTHCGVTPEERAMWDSATNNHNLSSRMRVFFVETFSPTTALGYSKPPFCATGIAAPYVNHVVLPNNALSDTLAHEFGHVLLNSGAHAGIDNSADNRNLMFAPGRTASDLDASQCATIYGNA